MDNFEEKLKKIKISRSPEAFLDNIFLNLKQYTHKKHSNKIFFIKNKKILFLYNILTNYFFYDYDDIYEKMCSKYKIEDSLYIIKLIEDKIHFYFGNNFNVSRIRILFNKEDFKNLKYKDFTLTNIIPNQNG